MKQKIPVLSFFSGAGFLDIGFMRQNKFDFVWHNECHAPFADAYEHGVGKLGYNTSNNKIQSRAKIENLRPENVIESAFHSKKIPPVFGVIGGPPCPDFSIAGKNKGGKGENGKLTGKFVNMIIRLRPTFFLLENVPGLLETKKHRMFLFRLLRKLSRHYAVDLRVLNALEYGVPQSRRRVFVVGFKKKWLRRNFKNNKMIFDKSEKIININISESRISDEIKSDLDELQWFCWPHPKIQDIGNGKCPKNLTVEKVFSEINGHPNAKDYFIAYSDKIVKNKIKEGDISRKSFKRLSRFLYSPNAAYGNNEVHLHPTKRRRISVAEALAIQSVPAKYSFPEDMTLTAKFKAVGNGVPVRLSECMAQAIFNFIQKGKTNGIF